jgi:hypothetical protein
MRYLRSGWGGLRGYDPRRPRAASTWGRFAKFGMRGNFNLYCILGNKNINREMIQQAQKISSNLFFEGDMTILRYCHFKSEKFT